ncbi:predicted protein, partial [Nematostella vectensis]
ESDICLTIDCIDTASELMSSVDPTVDPCENFYEYACGKWPAKNPIPIDETYWNQLKVLRDRNEKIIRKLITFKETRAIFSKIDALRKVFTFYDSCMDEEQIEKLKGQPLLDLLEKLGSCPGVRPDWNGSAWTVTDTLIKMHELTQTSAFFSFVFVPSDQANGTISETWKANHLLFRSNTLNYLLLQLPFFFFQIKKGYKKYMKDVLVLLGNNESRAEEVSESIFRVEFALAQVKISQTARNESSTERQLVSLKDLTHGNTSEINWLRFFTSVFKASTITPTMDFKVRVGFRKYFEDLPEYIRNTPKSDLANYMMWQIMRGHLILLSNPFIEAREGFNRLFGSTTKTLRWEKCVMETKIFLNYATSRLFVEAAFKNGSKTEAFEMVQDIKKVFIEDFETVDWMDEETKAAAKRKATALTENIAYPDWILDDEKLTGYYQQMSIGNESYFNNVISVGCFSNEQRVQDYNQPLDKNVWYMSPMAVNAQYLSLQNSMALPAGILQPPFFKKNYPMSVNFGGIGTIIGHEMTHGFDDSGRMYNQDGNKVKWWTNSSIEAFSKRAKCFEDVYSNYTYRGIKVSTIINGARVLSEAIADNAGTKLAYLAYKVWVDDHHEEKLLPGIKLKHDQIFFLSYAHIFCGSYSKNAAEDIVRMSVHPLHPIRINGVVSNSEEFAKAFSCPRGSPMNPEHKCEMW